MTEKVNFLPLGSIVVVSGGIKKYVIVDDYFSCLRKSKYINDNDVDTVIGIRK